MNSLISIISLFLLVSAAGCQAPPRSSQPDDTPVSSVQPVFTDVTKKAGLSEFHHQTGATDAKWFPKSMGAGGGFFDYNGDGWLDIILVGGGAIKKDLPLKHPALWLYENNQDGSFSLVTDSAGLGRIKAYGFGITAADYDNDSDQDFLLTTLHENKLFRNDGGIFTEVGQAAGIANRSSFWSSVIFLDANRDGWLDLYIGGYVDWSPENNVACEVAEQSAYCTPERYDGVPGRFYQNNGDGTFTDRTKEAGFASAPGKTLGAVTLDYNHDRWPDLFVANDTNRDLLYQNNGDGTFTERGMMAGVAFDANAMPRAGMGVDVGVVDSTGQPTIFVGNFSNEMTGAYRHTGRGLFMDRASVSQIGRPSLPISTFGLLLLDIDLDRDLDLLAANGHIQEHIGKIQDGITYRQPAQLFLNQGQGVFQDISSHAGQVFEQPLLARGAAYGDYDQDGDLDVLITENGGPAHLWRNDLPPQQFLRVKLVGHNSNQDGVGARITAFVDGQPLERRVHTGFSYLSQSEKIATFGLGDATSVDSLRVEWPSGKTSYLTDIEANQQITVDENQTALATR